MRAVLLRASSRLARWPGPACGSGAWRFALLLAFAWGAQASAAEQIVPLHQRVFLSGHPRWSHWSVPLQAVDGSTRYVLSLELHADRRQHVSAIELALHDAGAGADARNLLAPPGSGPGMQPFDFVAKDLAKGAENSTYGRARKIFAPRVGLIVRAAVLEAGVKPVSKSEFELDKLSLDIQIENQAR
jgi:hypothetical protein